MTAEALRNSSAVGLFIAPRPFSPHLDASEVAPGTSIGRMLTRAVNDGVLAADDLDLVRVYVDGQPVPCGTPDERAAAFDLVPDAGQLVNLSVEPEGGSNSDARSGLALLFNVIGTIASFTVGPFTAAMWFLAAATVPNLLFPINEPDRLETANDRGALQGAQNAIRRRDMMPLQLGRSREAFDVAAAPFTRLIGNDVWLTVIFGVHYGPCTVENIRIGETALVDYPAADVRIVEHLSPGPRDFTLYPARVAQENLSDQLEMGGAFEVHTTQANAERIEADLTWPAGLRFNKENGSILPQETRLEVQWQALDANGDPVGPYAAAPLEGGPYRTRQGATLPTGQIEVQGRTQDALRRTLAWNTGAKGRYNVRIRAWDPDGDDPSKAVQDVYWTALRTIETGKPILDETLSVIEFQIRSSDDLSGQLPVVTAEITPLAPVWDGDEWLDDPADWAPTSNAAALARMLLMGPGAARPMSGAEFDASCADAYELIEVRGWHAGFRLAQNTTQEEALQALGAMGRFSCYDPGDGLRFVTDWEKPATRQMFTGRNVQGYRFSRAFPEAVHAVIVEFRNLDESSEPDELIVYMDGYAEEAGDGVQAAELFESLRIPYACTADRAYREGRVWLAKRVHQVERHEWTAAADSIVSTYGDRVAVAHRSALFGQRAARVAHRHLSGGLVAGVRLDEPVEMVDGEGYALDVRRADQVLAGLEVTTVDGRHRDLWFPTPLAEAAAPEAGDLCVFGLSGQVTEDLELVDVDPQPDGKARLAAVKYIAAELEAAETGPIPPFETRVTARPRAPMPRILGTVGDPNGVRVIFDVDPVRGALVEGFTVRWRRSVAEVSPDEIAPGWVSLPPLGANAREAVTPPVLDAAAPDVLTEAEWSVDVEIRSILRSGAISVPAVASAVRVKRTVVAPENFAATGVTRTAPDGSSFGAIEVSCDPLEAGPTQDLVVEHQPAGSDPEAWVSAGQPLPSRNPRGDFLAGLSGQAYDVRGRWRTQDNWTSDWVVVEDVTIPAGSEVSYDVSPTSPTRQDIDALFVDVDDLIATYGDTASAAASAAAAAAAASAADTARALTEQALADAETAMAAAQDARDAAQAAQSAAQGAAGDAVAAATAAGGSADAAAGSASTASSHADAAAGSASAAAAQATAAQTSAGSASTSAGQAASSATDAAGSASAAASSASVAAAAGAAAVNTVRGGPVLPFDFRDGTLEQWTGTRAGDPATIATFSQGSIVSGDADFGTCLEITDWTTAGHNILTKGVLPARAGRTYEVRIRFKVTASDGSVGFNGILSQLLGNYAAHTPPIQVLSNQTVTTSAVQELTFTVSDTASSGVTAWTAGTVAMRFGLRLNSSEVGLVLRVGEIRVRDITEQAASAASAAASATSAAAAAASATTAGEQASAAQTSATNAATSAGSASTSASNAATSATNAAGSASAAASSASVAASAGASAQSVANRLLPDRPAVAADFSGAGTGSPDTRPDLSGGSVVTVDGEGDVREFVGQAWLFPKGVLPIGTGRTFRATARARVTADAGSNPVFGILFYVFDEAYVSLGGLNTIVDANALAADGWQTFTVEWTSEQLKDGRPTATYVRPRFIGGGNSGGVSQGNTWQIATFRVRDVTSEVAAAASAAASATSAAAAAASATTAGEQASAAQTSATNASTSAGSASTSASNAATSATNAAGSASAAASSASVAATAGAAAQSVANRLIPHRLSSASDFHASAAGSPDTRPDLSTGTVVSVAGEGDVRQWTTVAVAYTKGVLPVGEGRTFRLSARARITVDAGSPVFKTAFYVLDSAYANLGSFQSTSPVVTAADGWVTRTQEVTSAAVKAAHPTAAYLRPRLVGGGNASDTPQGATWQGASLRFWDATSEAASEASAAASATSASTAAASATAAGESASTATTQANNASTSAGSASTSASQSAASASSAAGSASAAQAAMNIAASVGSLALNQNPVFADYPTTPGRPTDWNAWQGADPTRVSGQVSPNGVRIVGAAGDSGGIIQSSGGGLLAIRPGWYVLEADITLDSGALTGGGLLFQVRNAANTTTQHNLLLSFATDKDITDAAPGAGTVGRTYRYRKLVQATSADSARANFFAQAHYTGHGSIAAANAIIFHRAAVRAATSAEIAAQRADANATSALASIDTLQTAVASNTSAIAALETDLSADIAGLSATVSIQAAAIADLEDNAAIASWQVVAVASGGNPARIGIASSELGADVVLDGDRVWFGPKTRFDVSANVYITDDAGVRTIQMGPFGASGNLIFWQGADSVAPGSATTANGTRAITRDGQAYVDGYRQQDVYREDATNVPGTTISTSWVDVLTMTIGAGPGVDDSFHVQVGLGIQTSPSRTRGSSSVQAPGGDWEVVEQDSSGTTGTERKIATGKWSTSIFGGGANPEYVSSITLGSPSSAEMAERSDISREWPFKFGSGGRLVVRMKADAGANLITPVVRLWSFVTRYT